MLNIRDVISLDTIIILNQSKVYKTRKKDGRFFFTQINIDDVNYLRTSSHIFIHTLYR